MRDEDLHPTGVYVFTLTYNASSESAERYAADLLEAATEAAKQRTGITRGRSSLRQEMQGMQLLAEPVMDHPQLDVMEEER